MLLVCLLNCLLVYPWLSLNFKKKLPLRFFHPFSFTSTCAKCYLQNPRNCCLKSLNIPNLCEKFSRRFFPLFNLLMLLTMLLITVLTHAKRCLQNSKNCPLNSLTFQYLTSPSHCKHPDFPRFPDRRQRYDFQRRQLFWPKSLLFVKITTVFVKKKK